MRSREEKIKELTSTLSAMEYKDFTYVQDAAEYLIEDYEKIEDIAEKILNDLLILFDNNTDLAKGIVGWNIEDIKMLLKLYFEKNYGVEIK